MIDEPGKQPPPVAEWGETVTPGPEAGSRVRVGVVLPRPYGDPGEWLVEAVAFEAAGADALWVEHGAAPEFEPLTLTAALAALTYRSLLAVAVRPEASAHALATVRRLSRDRLALITEKSLITEKPEDASPAKVVRRLEDGAYAEGGAGRWVPVAVPAGRAAWRVTLREAAERGDHGVLVPADPRLLDLLRNPDDPEGRLDLQLAQG